MSKDTLVFYDFFTQLRKQTDLPLDMDQYALFLELFVGGYAWGDKERLRRLCRALWLSLPKYGEFFDKEFDLAFEPLARQTREAAKVAIRAIPEETELTGESHPEKNRKNSPVFSRETKKKKKKRSRPHLHLRYLPHYRPLPKPKRFSSNWRILSPKKKEMPKLDRVAVC
ncbi:MAG: hypothetical protein IPN33_14240 [Saprospiraceae bacterium]|nr:hypothetical protein [Saprospiraceae bacterium]